MTTNTKRYTFVARKTGKLAKIGSFYTREEARQAKRIAQRDVAIFDKLTGQVVR